MGEDELAGAADWALAAIVGWAPVTAAVWMAPVVTTGWASPTLRLSRAFFHVSDTPVSVQWTLALKTSMIQAIHVHVQYTHMCVCVCVVLHIHVYADQVRVRIPAVTQLSTVYASY